MADRRRRAVCILGATATGKTRLAAAVAAAANGERFDFDNVEPARLNLLFGLIDTSLASRIFQLQFTFGQSF